MSSRGAASTPLGAIRSSSQLLQEAKKLKASLKALLEEPTIKPSSSEVEFARRNLRNTLLNLLFGHPFTRESHGIDVFLWIETTHPLVAAYRALLADLKKGLSSPSDGSAAAPKGTSVPKNSPYKANRKAKSVEHSKTLSDFRKFLIAEEVFWQELASRVTTTFGVDEARPCLSALDIPYDSDDDAPSEVGPRSGPGVEAFNRNGVSGQGQSDHKSAAQQPSNRQRLLEIIHKALIYCGDLARYREMYSETNRAGTQSKRSDNDKEPKHASAPSRKEKSPPYSRAVSCYEQARALLPHNGNPFNQIAVIAMYDHDFFSAVYHSYRALCVKIPFDTARQNLELAFRKVMHNWSADSTETRQNLPRTADAWLQHFIVLHAMFFLEHGVREVHSHSLSVHSSFENLLRERMFQTDQIVHVVVVALAASWTSRLWRTTSANQSSSSSKSKTLPAKMNRAAKLCVELQILSHTLALFHELTIVARSECDEAVQLARSSDGRSSAASKITAVFRRMLPAMRIITKWMKSHLDYIQRSIEKARGADLAMLSQLQDGPATEDERSFFSDCHLVEEVVTQTAAAFWRSYADFLNTVRFAFPYHLLPTIGGEGTLGVPFLCLEEDLDMRGFAPVRKAMVPFADAGMGDACGIVKQSDVHPNDEQLLRIADLLVDAKVVAESSASPLSYDDAQNAFRYNASSADHAGGIVSKSQSIQAHDGTSEIASEATDDILELAMHAVDQRQAAHARASNSDGEDDEHILIPHTTGRQTGARALSINQAPPGTPTQNGRGQTAQDLLLQVLNGPVSGSKLRPEADSLESQASLVPQAHLLFGGMGGSVHNQGAGNNIWSSAPSEANRVSPRQADNSWRSETLSSPLPPPGHPQAAAFQTAFSAAEFSGFSESQPS